MESEPLDPNTAHGQLARQRLDALLAASLGLDMDMDMGTASSTTSEAETTTTSSQPAATDTAHEPLDANAPVAFRLFASRPVELVSIVDTSMDDWKVSDPRVFEWSTQQEASIRAKLASVAVSNDDILKQSSLPASYPLRGLITVSKTGKVTVPQRPQRLGSDLVQLPGYPSAPRSLQPTPSPAMAKARSRSRSGAKGTNKSLRRRRIDKLVAEGKLARKPFIAAASQHSTYNSFRQPFRAPVMFGRGAFTGGLGSFTRGGSSGGGSGGAPGRGGFSSGFSRGGFTGGQRGRFGSDRGRGRVGFGRGGSSQ
ncbi:hypothetical protein BC831DRAFT_454784 [Entophlyctis helioformis]|nr:hypothetical protein BC831DRAFT_454784 [Entophlyctis helioformis]